MPEHVAPSPARTERPVLVAQGIRAGYGKKEILHGVDLTVAPGEIVLLIGPNGAGKSTFLKVLAGLVRPQEGRVVFAHTDVTSWPPYRRARAGIGYMIQGGAVFPSLSVTEHLALAGAAPRWGARKGSRNDAHSLLGRAVKARPTTRAGVLSGGERQSLAAATVLATKPRLLLADEPSAGLAPAAAAEVMRALVGAGRQRNVPIVWVEQRVADALPLVDRVVLLRGGRVVAETAEPRAWLDGDTLGALMFGEGE